MKLNKINLSGVSYDLEDLNAAKTVELTQAQYDALAVKDPNTFYVILDAEPVDMSDYYTKDEVDDELDGKQATLVSGTNIKTVNNESLLGEGNITIEGGGGSVTVDNALSTTSENPVANSAITNVLSAYYYAIKTSNSVYNNPFGMKSSNGCVGFSLGFSKITNPNDSSTGWLWVSKINNKNIINVNNSTPNSSTFNLSLVETSAITSSVTSASTDSQVPSAKAVYDALQESGGGTVDTELDSTSENPVQNKVIYQKFDEVEEVTAAALNALNDKMGDVETLLASI